MTTEITWGSLWWRIRLLLRIWWSDAQRWLVVRRRARRLGPRWRRKCRELGLRERFEKAGRGEVIRLDRAMKQAYLEQRRFIDERELRISGHSYLQINVSTTQQIENLRIKQAQLAQAEQLRRRLQLQQLSVVRRLPLLPPEHDDAT